ncbi:MAG TPA: ADOP family duplicated permease [Gemmatimonadaceae bacterium]|nr:ADOP family duplicated permease [Gemmatimonadaceae bacterium]
MSDSSRFRRFLRLPRRSRRTIESDIDDEFRFHLEMRERELRSLGRSPTEARREALRQFGDLADAREYCRTADQHAERHSRRRNWLDELRQDVLIASRLMRRNPRFALGATLTLAVGVAAATAAYSVLYAYLVRPLPYPDPDRLAFVIPGPSREPFPNAPSLRTVDWTKVDSVFNGTVAWDLDGFTLAGGDRPEYVDGAWVSPGYLTTLGVRPAVGRAFQPEAYTAGAPPVALISDALWARRFNRDSSIIGTTIRLHSTDRPLENELVTIVGVTAPGTWHVTRFTDVIRPLTTSRMPSIVRLKSGSTLAQAQAQLNAAVIPQLGEVPTGWRMSAVPVHEEYTHEVRPILVALFGAAAFMLLIAAGSVAGALVARAAGRRDELGIRGALGASRGRLVRQLLTETFVLAAVAAIAGTLLARFLIEVIASAVGPHLGVSVPGGEARLIPDIMVFALAIIAGSALGALFGLIPAVAATRGDVAASVRAGRNVSGPSRPIMRQSLIGAQIALTVVLLVGAGLMARTVAALRNAPLGFQTAGLLKADVLLPQSRYPDAAARRNVADRALAEIRRVPGIRAAALVFPYPFRQGGAAPISSEAGTRASDVIPRATVHSISPDYFRVMQISLISGRTFDDRDNPDAAAVVIISDGLARDLWSGESALGRRIRIGESEEWRTVVGVVNETLKTVIGEHSADVYMPYAQAPRAYTSIVVSGTSGTPPTAHDLQRAMARVDDVLALSDIRTLDEIVSQEGASRRMLATLLVGFALFALGLAALGLYASISYVVARRRRELAVRMAIGANAASIMRLVLGEGVVVVTGGVIAGVALSLALARVLASQVYGVATTDTLTLGAIVIIVTLAALSAIAGPLSRALRIDPASAMRVE